MRIPTEKVAETLERTDLVALVSRHVSLKPSGRMFKGLCPFHGEKTPSFYVNPERRTFKCFGCDVGGDAITFQQRMSGGTFVEVVLELAAQAGVSIPLDEHEEPVDRLKKELREANEFACRHFQERLRSDPRAKAGLDHLAARGVSRALASQFGLGYALNSWNDLTDRFVREGLVEQATSAGLCSLNRSGDGHFDTFRGRLMIPIRSLDGRTIAFGARLVEETPRADGTKGPKYLNSRESPLYRKSEILYGLDVAQDAIRAAKRAVLVEGYFDVLGLHAAGVTNSVALCSTALTAGHIAALQKIGATELTLLLDGDAAGAKAVERLAGSLLASPMTVRVAALPPGEDPDTFARTHGREAVEALLAAAKPLSTHLLATILPGGATAALEEKMAAFARMRAVVEQVPAGVARTLVVAEIARWFGLDESETRSALFAARAPIRLPEAKAPAAGDPAEMLLAALLVHDPELRELRDARALDELTSLDLRLWTETAIHGDTLTTLPERLRPLGEAKLREVERTLAGDERRDARRRAVGELANRIRLTECERQIENAKQLLRQMGEAPDAQVEELQTQLKDLFDARMRLKRSSTARAV